MTDYHESVKDDFDIKVMLMDHLDKILESYASMTEEITIMEGKLLTLEKKLPIWEKLQERIEKIRGEEYSYINTKIESYPTKIKWSINSLKARIDHKKADIEDLGKEWKEYEDMLGLYGVEDIMSLYDEGIDDNGK